MSRFLCMLALTGAMAITTWGIVAWAVDNYSLTQLWPFSGPVQLHPVHLIGFGLAVLPLVFSILLRPVTPPCPEDNS